MDLGQLLLTGIGLRIITALAIIGISAIVIKRSSLVVRKILSRKFEEATILNLFESIFTGVAWFSVTLIVLGTLGFNQIAASLGTASGFVALGISFALKNVLSDTVAGIYLAKDSDFNNGDKVEVDGVKGEITEVGLRKSRIELEDGNLRVINNSDVEKKWTLIKN